MKVYSQEDEKNFESLVRAEFMNAIGIDTDDMRSIISHIQERKVKINWKEIDKKLGQKSYNRMTFAYKHFRDVTVVSYQPSWTPQEKHRVDEYTDSIFAENMAEILKCVDDRQYTSVRGKMIQSVLSHFDIKCQSKPLKPMNDRIRVRLSNLYRRMVQRASPKEEAILASPQYNDYALVVDTAEDLYSDFCSFAQTECFYDKV